MRVHHTKNKGDLGVIAAELDLFEKGFILMRPLTEHAPFDLVGYRDERFFRISVKYRAAVDGQISVLMSSTWADRHGVHIVPVDKNAIDLVCVYCPDTRCCYYFDPKQIEGSIRLRIAPPRNNQKKRVHMAENYREIPVTVRGVAPGGDAFS